MTLPYPFLVPNGQTERRLLCRDVGRRRRRGDDDARRDGLATHLTFMGRYSLVKNVDCDGMMSDRHAVRISLRKGEGNQKCVTTDESNISQSKKLRLLRANASSRNRRATVALGMK